MAMLTVEKIDNSKTVTGDKERHYIVIIIIIKESSHQWNIRIVSTHTVNVKPPKHIRGDPKGRQSQQQMLDRAYATLH